MDISPLSGGGIEPCGDAPGGKGAPEYDIVEYGSLLDLLIIDELI